MRTISDSNNNIKENFNDYFPKDETNGSYWDYLGMIPTLHKLDFSLIKNKNRGFTDSFCAIYFVNKNNEKSTNSIVRHVVATSLHEIADQSINHIFSSKNSNFISLYRLYFYAKRQSNSSIKGHLIFLPTKNKRFGENYSIEDNKFHQKKFVNYLAKLEWELIKYGSDCINIENCNKKQYSFFLNLHEKIKISFSKLLSLFQETKYINNVKNFLPIILEVSIRKHGFVFMKKLYSPEDEEQNIHPRMENRQFRMCYYYLSELFHKHDSHSQTTDDWLGISNLKKVFEKSNEVKESSEIMDKKVNHAINTFNFNIVQLINHMIERPLKKIKSLDNELDCGINNFTTFKMYLICMLDNFYRLSLIGKKYRDMKERQIQRVFYPLQDRLKRQNKDRKFLRNFIISITLGIFGIFNNAIEKNSFEIIFYVLILFFSLLIFFKISVNNRYKTFSRLNFYDKIRGMVSSLRRKYVFNKISSNYYCNGKRRFTIKNHKNFFIHNILLLKLFPVLCFYEVMLLYVFLTNSNPYREVEDSNTNRIFYQKKIAMLYIVIFKPAFIVFNIFLIYFLFKYGTLEMSLV